MDGSGRGLTEMMPTPPPHAAPHNHPHPHDSQASLQLTLGSRRGPGMHPSSQQQQMVAASQLLAQHQQPQQASVRKGILKHSSGKSIQTLYNV